MSVDIKPTRPSPVGADEFINMAPGTLVQGLWIHRREMLGRVVSLSVGGWADEGSTMVKLENIILDYFSDPEINFSELTERYTCYDLTKQSLVDVKAALLSPTLPAVAPYPRMSQANNLTTTKTVTRRIGEPVGVYMGRFFAAKTYGDRPNHPSLSVLAQFLLPDLGLVWFILKERQAPGFKNNEEKNILEVY